MFLSTRFRWFPSHLSRKCFSKNRCNKLQTISNSTEGSQQCLGWDILHVTWENSANIHQNPPSYWGAPAILAVGCFYCVLMFIHCRLLWIQDAWGTKKVVTNSWEEFRGTRAPVSPYSVSLDRQTRVSMWGLYSIGRIIEAGFGVCWQASKIGTSKQRTGQRDNEHHCQHCTMASAMHRPSGQNRLPTPAPLSPPCLSISDLSLIWR